MEIPRIQIPKLFIRQQTEVLEVLCVEMARYVASR